MRVYEVVCILDSALSEEDVASKTEAFNKLLTKTDGAEVIVVEPWGIRQLAYPLKTVTQGHYVVSHVKGAAEDLVEFERALTLDSDVLRYLIVVNEGEPATGKSLVSDRPVRVRDDDDDDDDDGDDARRPSSRDDDDDDDADADEEPLPPGSAPPEFAGGRGRFRRTEGPSIELLNYKDVGTLSRFMTEQGKILPKRTTKVPAAFQRKLGRAIKRARFLALIPYVRDHEA